MRPLGHEVTLQFKTRVGSHGVRHQREHTGWGMLLVPRQCTPVYLMSRKFRSKPQSERTHRQTSG